MQRCDGKQGCTNQIGGKKGEKRASLSFSIVATRITDIWAENVRFGHEKRDGSMNHFL
jgi:hypothetical protein